MSALLTRSAALLREIIEKARHRFAPEVPTAETAPIAVREPAEVQSEIDLLAEPLCCDNFT